MHFKLNYTLIMGVFFFFSALRTCHDNLRKYGMNDIKIILKNKVTFKKIQLYTANIDCTLTVT